jgi:hypothetical protein
MVLVYRNVIKRHKDLSDFFKKETGDTLNQLCDDFSKILTTTKIVKLYNNDCVVLILVDHFFEKIIHY